MERMSMAQACGEAPTPDTAWVPGVDFDPHDDEEMEVMREVWARDLHEKVARLEDENARLRAQLYPDAE